MKRPLLLAMPGNAAMATLLSEKLEAERRDVETLRFPDQESYVAIGGDPRDRAVALLCALDRPDDKVLPLLLAADAARDLGATQVGLVAPYLAYMRQDKRFAAGDAVSARTFARIITQSFDWLVTVDPHLHRIKALSEIYQIPTRVAHAAEALARWINANVDAPLLIGPDSESEQWVAETATKIGAPYAVLSKTRTSSDDVKIKLASPMPIRDRTPVMLDDIISTGHTLIESVRLVRARTQRTPLCVAIHGIFSGDALRELAALSCRVVTSNTIAHETNAIDLSGEISDATKDCISRGIWSKNS